jgi:hypothetical protein
LVQAKRAAWCAREANSRRVESPRETVVESW